MKLSGSKIVCRDQRRINGSPVTVGIMNRWFFRSLAILCAVYFSGVSYMSIYLLLFLVSLVAFIICILVPFTFRCFPSLMKSFIFTPKDEIPENLDYQHPETSGFVGGRNFYLETEDGAKLGVWHTLPAWSPEEYARHSELPYDDMLQNATVMLYLHGSAGTRTSPHRLRLYKILNKLNCHVIAFDYRGYGDSSCKPTSESDLINDAKTVFRWIQDRVVGGQIYLWGHSLGTGVGSHLADVLAQVNVTINGIILESPFNNMADAIRASKLAETVSFLPWFDDSFIEPLKESDMCFESDKHLSNVSTPTLILHAEDDNIIPISLANQLYTTVLEARKESDSVEIVRYSEHLGYGHYNIPLDPNIGPTIMQFIQKTSDK